MNPRARYDEIAADLEARDPDVQLGQMMGRPCIKAGGKIIAGYEAKGSMVFKLPDEGEREKALALDGAAPFDPMGSGRVNVTNIERPPHTSRESSSSGSAPTWRTRLCA